MKLAQHLSKSLRRNLGMLVMTLEDFSDNDLLVRPVDGANHANWQIGHLILAEHNMVSAAGGKMPPLPAGFAEKYSRDTAKTDDASKFLKKDELLTVFQEVRAASASFAKDLSDENLEAQSPEMVRPLAPTIADLMTLLSLHMTMHLGQIQVIRRKLGKPVLF
jgi:uncharacterized damage-inducible protein DinB